MTELVRRLFVWRLAAGVDGGGSAITACVR